ncbi:MAG: NrtA/SsuA/CpmA family ABC transporter substrate-binding protein [Desulfoferrobacter sp.]
MHTVLNGAKICVFATMFTGEQHLAVLGRKDRGISSPKDLKGKRIGVSIGTNGEYFLDTVLLLNGVPRDQIEAVNVEPKRMIEVLMKGDVDAIATWNPQLYEARKELGTKGVTFYAEGFYSPVFIIAARQDYAEQKPDTMQRVVRALIQATDFIQSRPEESRGMVTEQLGADKDILNGLNSTYRFKITLDQSLLVTLESQAKWAIKNGLTDAQEIPNFLDFICSDALERVNPEAVDIIR